ncbi:MAG: hypothetical protein JXR80_01760 [Deltaproteobacteria bacterium]|nr:hypothetical protein [Deltaproteobacteria bacterium]
MNNFGNYFSNAQFDWQSIVFLIVGAVVLYIAFRIGAFILKIAVGLAAIVLIIFGISKILPYLGL